MQSRTDCSTKSIPAVAKRVKDAADVVACLSATHLRRHRPFVIIVVIAQKPLASLTRPVAACVWAIRWFKRGPNDQRKGHRHSMPKIKTHKAASKRLKVTSTGKIMRMKGLRGHLRRKRAHRATEKYDKMFVVSPADKKRLALLLPYGTP